MKSGKHFLIKISIALTLLFALVAVASSVSDKWSKALPEGLASALIIIFVILFNALCFILGGIVILFLALLFLKLVVRREMKKIKVAEPAKKKRK